MFLSARAKYSKNISNYQIKYKLHQRFQNNQKSLRKLVTSRKPQNWNYNFILELYIEHLWYGAILHESV